MSPLPSILCSQVVYSAVPSCVKLVILYKRTISQTRDEDFL